MPPAMVDQTVLIAQSTSESPNAFAQRVLSRIAALERMRRHFQTIVVLLAERRDSASRAARRLIVLALAAHLRARGGPATLALRSRPSASADERRELLELAGELTEFPSALSVKVTFDEPWPGSARGRSGIFPRSTRGDSSKSVPRSPTTRRWPEAT